MLQSRAFASAARSSPNNNVRSQVLRPCQLTRQIDAALSEFSHVAGCQVCQISIQCACCDHVLIEMRLKWPPKQDVVLRETTGWRHQVVQMTNTNTGVRYPIILPQVSSMTQT